MSNHEVRLYRRTEYGNPIISPYVVRREMYARVKRELDENGNVHWRNGTGRYITLIKKNQDEVREMKTQGVSESTYLRVRGILEENSKYSGEIRRKKR